MAQSGYTPIILYKSGTASAVPTTGNLALGELAINYTDGKLYYNTGSTVAVLASATSSGITLSSANTWTNTQTLNGSSSVFGLVSPNIAETTNIVGSAPTSTTNFYLNNGSVQYYTTSAANNWTLNIAFSSGTSLNTALSTGQTVTIALLAAQGGTAYYNNAVTIDGTSVTPLWQGGTAPTKGNASGIDVYTYTITKTASATYTVLASQTQFA
jgi:hypothetical protein